MSWQDELAAKHGLPGARKRRVLGRSTPKVMGKWEAIYAQRLDLLKHAGEVVGYVYEPFKIILGERCTYTPDFLVQLPGGRFEVHEVKGYEREDSVVKFKTAAERLRFWTFRMWTIQDGSWVETRILNN